MLEPDKVEFCNPAQYTRHKELVTLGYKSVFYHHTSKYFSVHYTEKDGDDELIAHFLKSGGFKFFSKDG